MQNYAVLNSLGTAGELVPLGIEHAFSIAILGSDPAILKWVNIPFNQTLTSAEDFVKERIAEAETGESATFVLICEDAVIGCCSLHSFSRARDEAEVAFWLGRCYWGLGWGTEMCRSLVTIARQKRSVSVLIARCLRPNRRAIGVLRKCAFRPANLLGKDIRLFTLRLASK
jgi:RimJ/RimL family protein N-acetyltransferase